MQILLPEIGAAGQARLAEACVAVVGLGALGSHAAQMLARIGVGRLILADDDRVGLDNLHRQVLYDEEDAKQAVPKALRARERLLAANSGLQIRAHPVRVAAGNVADVLADAEVVVDGTDNLASRFLLNDYAVSNEKAFIHGAVVGWSGTVMVIKPGGRPCLACLYPELPDETELETTRSAGVFPTAPGLIAQLQVTETVKVLLGREPMDRMVLLDLWTGETVRNRVAAQSNCRCCAGKDFSFLAG